jgi:hypothetical protein
VWEFESHVEARPIRAAMKYSKDHVGIVQIVVWYQEFANWQGLCRDCSKHIVKSTKPKLARSMQGLSNLWRESEFECEAAQIRIVGARFGATTPSSVCGALQPSAEGRSERAPIQRNM